MNLREYAGILTGVTSTMIATAVMIEVTTWDLLEMSFMAFMIGALALIIFLVVTEPRKPKKAHWEKSGELEVMVMGRRKNGRK